MRVGLAFVGLFLLGLCLCGCGVVTAPASVPYAVSQNAFLGLKGTITDRRGNPVDDVTVTVKRAYYLWHVNGNRVDTDTQTYMCNHDFDIPVRRAQELTFTFHKTGYGNTVVTVDADATGDGWPNSKPFQVVLGPVSNIGVPSSAFYAGTRFINCTNPSTRRSVMDILNVSPFAIPDAPPPRLLYVSGTPQHFVSGQKIDPLDINLPASLTFHLDEADDGLIQYDPPPSSDPFGQMTPAPQEGYRHELTLSAERLRQLRDPKSKMYSAKMLYFFFRANGRYGKAQLSWYHYNDGSGHPNENVEFQVALCVRRDGGRELGNEDR